MAQLYHSDAVRITHKRYVSSRWPVVDLAIEELSEVYVVQLGRPRRSPILVCSAAGAGATGLAIAFEWPAFDPPLLAAMAIIAIAAGSAAARVCLSDPGVIYQLWGVHFGVHVCLLSICDMAEFNQVKRALVRAMEG